jgi:undecaprenyl diphosphate synthase
MTQLSNQSIGLPTHIAIIMDGNGRWAMHRSLPRVMGHQAGLEATVRLLHACAKRHIKILTLFAFSSENWKRPEQEVKGLLQLFLQAFGEKLNILIQLNIRLRVIGDLTRFDAVLTEKIKEAIALTQENTGLILVIAVNYGGQWDIVQAAQSLCHQVADGVLKAEEIDANRFANQLQLAELPCPDLCIRSGGECRISNFLLWHLAYSEFYFTPTLWPDFDEMVLDDALAWYAKRERRFGTVKEEKNAL